MAFCVGCGLCATDLRPAPYTHITKATLLKRGIIVIFRHTDDGYIIRLERLPRHGSRQAVYLQHGVFDNAATFISTGTVCGDDVWSHAF